MRFHIGLSLNWKTIKKWLLPIFIGIITYLGLGYFNCIQVHALTPTIDKQAYYYHGNMTTQTNEFCIVSNDNRTCSPDRSVGLSPWLVATDLSFYTQINAGYFSGSAVIYLHTVSNGSVTFYNRDITSNNVNIGIASYEFPGNGLNVSDVQITNFSIQNIENTNTGGLAGTNYISKVTFDFKAYTDLQGSYYIKVGVGARAGSDGLFQQLSGEAYNDAMLLFTSTTSGEYVSRITINSGNLSDQKLDNITEEQKETNKKLDETNKNLDEIEDSITNPNVDSGTGNSFFDNFQSEDNGGISGIITAPLTLINSLLDGQGTCTDLTFPIMGKEVDLPSGCIIWDKVPNEMETLIQTLVCGTSAYFLLKMLFKDIEKLKNPNNSEVSTLDL